MNELKEKLSVEWTITAEARKETTCCCIQVCVRPMENSTANREGMGTQTAQGQQTPLWSIFLSGTVLEFGIPCSVHCHHRVCLARFRGFQVGAPAIVFPALDDKNVEVRRNIYEALANTSTTGPGESTASFPPSFGQDGR